LFKRKICKFTNSKKAPQSIRSNKEIAQEFKKNRYASIKLLDKVLLYISLTMGGWLIPSKLWWKKDKLIKFYNRGSDRIEARLNMVKIAKNQTDMKVLLKNSMMNEDILYQIRHSAKHFINLDTSSDD